MTNSSINTNLKTTVDSSHHYNNNKSNNSILHRKSKKYHHGSHFIIKTNFERDLSPSSLQDLNDIINFSPTIQSPPPILPYPHPFTSTVSPSTTSRPLTGATTPLSLSSTNYNITNTNSMTPSVSENGHHINRISKNIKGNDHQQTQISGTLIINSLSTSREVTACKDEQRSSVYLPIKIGNDNMNLPYDTASSINKHIQPLKRNFNNKHPIIINSTSSVSIPSTNSSSSTFINEYSTINNSHSNIATNDMMAASSINNSSSHFTENRTLSSFNHSLDLPVTLNLKDLMLTPTSKKCTDATVWLTKLEGTHVYITWLDPNNHSYPVTSFDSTIDSTIDTNTSVISSSSDKTQFNNQVQDQSSSKTSTKSASSNPSEIISADKLNLPSTAIPIMRRVDNDRINATLLLHAGGMHLEQEKSIILSLENNKVRYARKKTSGLAGTWIPIKRARDLARSFALDMVLDTFLSDTLGGDYFDLKKKKDKSNHHSSIPMNRQHHPHPSTVAAVHPGTPNHRLSGLAMSSPASIINGTLEMSMVNSRKKMKYEDDLSGFVGQSTGYMGYWSSAFKKIPEDDTISITCSADSDYQNVNTPKIQNAKLPYSPNTLEIIDIENIDDDDITEDEEEYDKYIIQNGDHFPKSEQNVPYLTIQMAHFLGGKHRPTPTSTPRKQQRRYKTYKNSKRRTDALLSIIEQDQREEEEYFSDTSISSATISDNDEEYMSNNENLVVLFNLDGNEDNTAKEKNHVKKKSRCKSHKSKNQLINPPPSLLVETSGASNHKSKNSTKRERIEMSEKGDHQKLKKLKNMETINDRNKPFVQIKKEEIEVSSSRNDRQQKDKKIYSESTKASIKQPHSQLTSHSVDNAVKIEDGSGPKLNKSKSSSTSSSTSSIAKSTTVSQKSKKPKSSEPLNIINMRKKVAINEHLGEVVRRQDVEEDVDIDILGDDDDF